jgi:hypothetical protein
VKAPGERSASLFAIKVIHTVVWLFFAGCILSIPIAAALRRFRLASVLSGLVYLECAVLAMNKCRCPLTDLADRFTEDRPANFDIYLPLWLARRNKTIFGTIFVIAELFLLCRWWFPRALSR